jgi:hypothetical protein
MNTRNYHRESYRAIQPICLAFIHEHEMKPTFYEEIDYRNFQMNIRGEYAERLHHHAILAVHHEHLDRMNELIGTNTLVGNFSHKVMTSFIAPRPVTVLRYASSMMKKYPDFLSFPDRLNTK